MYPKTTSHYQTLPSGEKIFYRKAGNASAPALLLLHGFPSSSHQFRNLIPLLASKYNIIAPDLPGFGFTEVPAGYTYTFENLATTIGTFIKTIPDPPSKYSIYIFDYGAPTGLRLALSNPAAVSAIISQNGNAYDEGLGDFWAPIRAYWASGKDEDRKALLSLFTLESTKWQYENGSKHPEAIAPESYTLDQAGLDRPGNNEIQLDLFYDYRTNLPLYPEFQKYFRESNVPLLAAWGMNDKIFVPEGALAFRRDLPGAEIHLLDAGHFAVETETEEIAGLILDFLGKNGI